jgi:tRNA 2-(methylsulfanyl)-N6-isopentenyladenosine37 hydroxylase
VKESASLTEELPLLSHTPLEWAKHALSDPLALLADHAFLEKKAANNALDLLTRWPEDFVPGWVTAITGIAHDETSHLRQVMRLLLRRGGEMPRGHANPYARDLRLLVHAGEPNQTLDRLYVSALIELRSCERFSVLAEAAEDQELSAFYHSLYLSERGHFKTFLKLAFQADSSEARWREMLVEEARILATQKPGPRMHSGI